MDEGAPRASVAVYAGQTLELCRAGESEVLRDAGGALVARLTPTGAETGDGRWTLVNRRGSEVDALREGSDEVLARYRPGIVGGGTVRIAGGERYVLRPPTLGAAWKLRRSASRALVASFVSRGDWDVTLAQRAAGEPSLPLVLVLSLRALLVEEVMPPAMPGPSTGP